MTAQNWVLGAVLAVLLGGLVFAVGGPTWAIILGLVAGMLVVVLTLGLRECRGPFHANPTKPDPYLVVSTACPLTAEQQLDPANPPDLEDLTAEEVVRWALDRFHPGDRARLLVPEGGERCCSTCCSPIEPDARVFALDTHVLFPETYDVWRATEQRYGTRSRSTRARRSAARPPIHGDALWAREPDALLRDPQGRAARPRARRPRRLDHRHAPRAVADARERAARSSGTSATSSGRPTRSPTGPSATSAPTSASASCPYNPLHDRGYSSIGCTHCTAARHGPRGTLDRQRQDRVRAARMTHEREPPPLPPRRARGRGDPHHARGRRRARAPGAALLRRQGLDRPAAPRREGVPPRAASRSRVMHVDTGPQLPRGDRVPRPPRRRARRAPGRRLRAGVDRRGPRRRADGPARLAQPAADDDAARRDRGAPVRRRDRRRPPRRGALAREGAHLLASATTSAAGTRARSGPSSGSLYNGEIRTGEHVRVFPISNWTELDVWQYVARESLELPSIYFAHEREVFERDGMLYADVRRDRARRRRDAVPASGCASAPSAT